MAKKVVLDVQGKPCPQPVLEIKNAMMNADEVEALVSGKDQVTNITRMADRLGWVNTVQMEENVFRVHLTHKPKILTSDSQPTDQACSDTILPENTLAPVLVISSEFMGRGDDGLGKILMKAFLETITDCSRRPRKLILFNSGVKLAVSGSLSIEALKKLQTEGIEILVCGTCLEYYHLKEDLKIGVVSNMFDIADTMLGGIVLNIA